MSSTAAALAGTRPPATRACAPANSPPYSARAASPTRHSGACFTRGDAIVAPPAGAVLDSVTLTILAETCRRDGVGWREEATDFRAVAAGTAGVDGVWLAGSGFGVAPVLRASWGESSADYPAGALVREVWGRRG